MPFTAILFGILLIAVGVGGYFYTGSSSLTALIPAAFGVVLALLGILSAAKDRLRKHAMHAAAAIALIGFIMPAVMALPKVPKLISEGKVLRPDGTDATTAVLIQLSMAVLCLLFVVLCINSFIAARRRRRQGQADQVP